MAKTPGVAMSRGAVKTLVYRSTMKPLRLELVPTRPVKAPPAPPHVVVELLAPLLASLKASSS